MVDKLSSDQREVGKSNYYNAVTSYYDVNRRDFLRGIVSAGRDKVTGENHHPKLELVRLMCLWLAGRNRPSSVALLPTQVTAEQVTDLLLDLIDEQYDWDVHRPYDIQMVHFVLLYCIY